MCLPILAAVGTAVSVVGALSSASAQASADRANAAEARIQAQASANKTSNDATQAGRKFDRVQGQAINVAGASGITPQSFQAVFDDNANESALEKASIRYNGEMQTGAYAYKAKVDDANAGAAQTGGFINAFGALIQGGTSIAKLSNPNREPLGDASSGSYGVQFNSFG